MADPRAHRHGRQQAEGEGDHQGEVGVVGDRQDHRRDRHRDQLGVPGLDRQEPGQPERDDRERADRGDPPEVAGDLRLVAVDVVADQGEHRGGQDQDRARPAGARSPQRPLGVGDLVLLAEQEELLLADLLALLDEQLALAVGLVDVGDGVAGLLAELVGVRLLEGERGRAGQPVGDQGEEALARARGVEGGDELLADGSVGLVEPLAHHPVAGDRVGLLAGLAGEVDREGPAGLLVPGEDVGAEHAVADQGLEGLADPPA